MRSRTWTKLIDAAKWIKRAWSAVRTSFDDAVFILVWMRRLKPSQPTPFSSFSTRTVKWLYIPSSCNIGCTNVVGFFALISCGTVSNPSLVISGAFSQPSAQIAGPVPGARSVRVFMIQSPRELQYDSLKPNASNFSDSVGGPLRDSRSYRHSRFFWEHRVHFGFWTTHFRFEVVQFVQALRRLSNIDMVVDKATRSSFVWYG